MNDTIFCNSFAFNNFHFTNYKYTDNSAGIHIHYFAYMTRGHAKICAENETVAIREGDIFYIPHGCQYRSYWYGDPDIEFISLGFRFLPNFKGRYYPPQVIARNEAAVQMMQSLVRRPPDEAAVGEFYTLTSLLMPNMYHRKSGRQASLVERARELILLHPEYTVGEIAKECAVSESALYAAFHRHSEKSIGEIRKSVVMEAARVMLISTDLSIEEVSRKIHFSSATHFRKCFKEHFGISPREMRKSERL